MATQDKNTVKLIADLSPFGTQDGKLSKKERAELAEFGIPPKDSRQPDLLYFKSVLVSAGANLNSAFFMPSELVKSDGTANNKAVDIYHDEAEVVGHILSTAFTAKDGSIFAAKAAMDSMSPEAFEKERFDISNVAVIYKLRFPHTAMSVFNGEFKVSMECYYEDFDILLPESDFILTSDEAVKSGIIELVGRKVKVVDGNDKKVDSVYRVLRNIVFSGMGLVTNPANPESIITEVAAHDPQKPLVEIDLNTFESYRKSKQERTRIEISSTEETIETTEEEEELGAVEDNKVETDESAAVLPYARDGQCVDYKRFVHDTNPLGSVSQVVREEYCALFELDCPTGGIATNLDCWMNVFARKVKTELNDSLWERRIQYMDLIDLIGKSPLDHPTVDSRESIDAIRREIELHKNEVKTQEFETLDPGLLSLDRAMESADAYLSKSKNHFKTPKSS